MRATLVSVLGYLGKLPIVFCLVTMFFILNRSLRCPTTPKLLRLPLVIPCYSTSCTTSPPNLLLRRIGGAREFDWFFEADSRW